MTKACIKSSLNTVTNDSPSFYDAVIIFAPPSIGMIAPVIKDELSEAKKAIKSATSLTCPGLPKAFILWQRPSTCWK